MNVVVVVVVVGVSLLIIPARENTLLSSDFDRNSWLTTAAVKITFLRPFGTWAGEQTDSSGSRLKQFQSVIDSTLGKLPWIKGMVD